jgi:hypothetical protein
MPAQKILAERTKACGDAIAAVHYRQNKREYEMRAATLDEKTRQHMRSIVRRHPGASGRLDFELQSKVALKYKV